MCTYTIYYPYCNVEMAIAGKKGDYSGYIRR